MRSEVKFTEEYIDFDPSLSWPLVNKKADANVYLESPDVLQKMPEKRLKAYIKSVQNQIFRLTSSEKDYGERNGYPEVIIKGAFL